MSYATSWWDRWYGMTGKEVPAPIRKTKLLNNHKQNGSVRKDAREPISQEFKNAA